MGIRSPDPGGFVFRVLILCGGRLVVALGLP